jgi:TonB family protein
MLSIPSEPPRLEAPRLYEPALIAAVATSPPTKNTVRAAGFADSPIQTRAHDVQVNVGSFQGSPVAVAEPSSAGRKSDARPSGFGNTLAALADGKPGPAIGSSGFVSASVSEARGAKSATVPAGFNAVRGRRGEARPIQIEVAPEVTPVQILSKPRPRYTTEARERRVEGEVTLEARFSAEGRVEILRVLRGLGYGLDESAAEAVREMKFRPATRGGVAVDTVLGVSVAFRLAY